jgi:ABC-type branched-subunit amino acid transport system ATPase component
MANPRIALLDERSMGLAPQIVEEVFEIISFAQNFLDTVSRTVRGSTG